jgi:hypothetical protein
LSPRKINRSGSALIIESQMGWGWNCFAQEPKAIFCNGVSAADRHGLQAARRINAAHLEGDFIRLETKTHQNDFARLIFFEQYVFEVPLKWQNPELLLLLSQGKVTKDR